MNYNETLELLNKKDKKGLEALYELYGSKLYSYAIRKWDLTEDESWDVVYQTLDTLVLKLSGYSFESQQHFDNFIFKVFVNFLRQFFRSHRKHQQDIVYVDFSQQETAANIGEDGNIEELGLMDTSIVDDHHFNEFYQSDVIENPKLTALKAALDKMDETEKSILLLRAQNYSYEEIATMLRIDDKQLKVKHHRSKAKLLKLLNQHTNDHHAKQS